MSQIAVKKTVGMDALLADTTLCKTIYRALPEIERVFRQIQLDSVTEDNRDTVGPTILALGRSLDTFNLIGTKGGAIAKTEEKQTKP